MSLNRHSPILRGMLLLGMVVTLAGCQLRERTDPEKEDAVGDTAGSEASEASISIIREDVRAEVAPLPLPDPRQQAIYFDLGQTDVSDAARAELAGLVRQLDLASVEWNLALTGHTDASGSAIINQRISAQRAQAVRDALEQLGVPAASISMAPSAAADTSPPPAPADPAQARRVDIQATALRHIEDPDATAATGP